MDKLYQHQKKLILFTIQALVLTVLGLFVLVQIRSVLLVWFLSFILMTAINPLVDFFVQRKLSRGVGILLAMVMVVLGLSLLLAGIIPTMVKETNALIGYTNKNINYLQYFQVDKGIISQLETISRGALNVVKIVSMTVSNVLALVSLIVLTVYLLVYRYSLKYALRYAFKGPLAVHKAEHLVNEIEFRLGGWVRAEGLLMLMIGAFSFIGLSIMRVPFALPLALLAGILELVPNIGPIISAIPAAAAGLSISPASAVGVCILYLIIHQSESHLIVPMIMKQSAGLNPLITLFCLMTGATLGGIKGAVLGVPIFIALVTIVRTINHESHLQIPVPEDKR